MIDVPFKVFKMCKLVKAIQCFCRSGTRVFIGYEHRANWETLDAFWDAATAAGLQRVAEPVDGDDYGDEEDSLLLELVKK